MKLHFSVVCCLVYVTFCVVPAITKSSKSKINNLTEELAGISVGMKCEDLLKLRENASPMTLDFNGNREAYCISSVFSEILFQNDPLKNEVQIMYGMNNHYVEYIHFMEIITAKNTLGYNKAISYWINKWNNPNQAYICEFSMSYMKERKDMVLKWDLENIMIIAMFPIMDTRIFEKTNYELTISFYSLSGGKDAWMKSLAIGHCEKFSFSNTKQLIDKITSNQDVP